MRHNNEETRLLGARLIRKANYMFIYLKQKMTNESLSFGTEVNEVLCNEKWGKNIRLYLNVQRWFGQILESGVLLK